MLKMGYALGKGIRKNYQGESQAIEVVQQQDKTEIGYSNLE